MSRELLRVIEIPNYPSRVLIAKSRRPVFYVNMDSSVKGKTDIPKSFLKNTEKYSFDSRGVLFNNVTGEPQIANPYTAGKPRYWVVNFQDIYNQSITQHARNMRIDKLKNILKPYIIGVEALSEQDYPLEICINLYDVEMPVDISNKGVIYIKVIEDLLKKEGKIIDDKIDFVNSSGGCKFVKVEDESEIKMEVKIYKSDNQPN